MQRAEAPAEHVLVIDDDPGNSQRVLAALRSPGRRIHLAGSAHEGLAAVHDQRPDLIVVSLDLRELPGVRVLDVLGQRAPGVPLVAVARLASVEGAVQAMRRGAADYVPSPVHPPQLLEALDVILHDLRGRRDLEKARAEEAERYGFTHMLTRSPRMLQVFEDVRAVAGTDATVLIRGETGTGKELISKAIHDRSPRKDRSFIPVNCGAFSESLLESELFGHERGSFTGATGQRRGVFELADRGTLFLDELGEISQSVQVNLLRVLETFEFRRVGGHDPVRVDVRIIAATNVHLEKAVKEGGFREDLYYRLNVFPILLPPLRERPEDVPLLMRHFLEHAAREYNLEAPAVTAECMQVLQGYAWPGNVRQLRSLCERWVITRHGRRLEADQAGRDLPGASASPALNGLGPAVDTARPLTEVVARATELTERAYLLKLLQVHNGHQGQVADAAGITRRTLYTKMKHYGFEASDFR